MVGNNASFFDGVGFEGVAVFNDFGRVGNVFEGFDFKGVTEHLLDFTLFASVAGCDDKGVHWGVHLVKVVK